MTRQRAENAIHLEDLLSGSQVTVVRDVLSEESFRRMIAIERKRTERTKEPFLLMLLECVDRQKPGRFTHALDNLMTIYCCRPRGIQMSSDGTGNIRRSGSCSRDSLLIARTLHLAPF